MGLLLGCVAGRPQDGSIGLLGVAGLVWACVTYVVATPHRFRKME